MTSFHFLRCYVIGPIFRATFPSYKPVIATSFSDLGCVIVEACDVLKFRQTLNANSFYHVFYGASRTTVSWMKILLSECSSTVLASPDMSPPYKPMSHVGPICSGYIFLSLRWYLFWFDNSFSALCGFHDSWHSDIFSSLYVKHFMQITGRGGWVG